MLDAVIEPWNKYQNGSYFQVPRTHHLHITTALLEANDQFCPSELLSSNLCCHEAIFHDTLASSTYHGAANYAYL